jgi:hypothetical protein
VAGVEVGTLAVMQAQYERMFFASTILPWIGGTLAGVITLLFGVLWLRRPDRLLALLTIAGALWMARSLFFIAETMPIEARFWMALVYYGSSGGFAAVMTLALLRLSGRVERRDDISTVGFALFGPLLAPPARRATPRASFFAPSPWAPCPRCTRTARPTGAAESRRGTTWATGAKARRGTARPTRAAAPHAHPHHFRRLDRLVRIVREDVELALLVQVNVVVAGARPVAVVVDQRLVQRQKFQRPVDVEDRLQRRLQLVHRRLVQHLAQVDQRRPALR